MTSNYKIIRTGWYLISVKSGDTINTLISTEVDAPYRILGILGVKSVYVPLGSSYTTNDGSAQQIEISPSNLEFESMSDTDPFLDSSGSLGVTPSTSDFDTNTDLALIPANEYGTKFVADFGIWVCIEPQTVTPHLCLEITNDNVYSIVTDASYQNMGGNGSYYSTIYSSTNGEEPILSKGDTHTITIESSGNQIIELVIQKDFEFSTSMIIPTITGNEPYLEFYTGKDYANKIESSGTWIYNETYTTVGTDITFDTTDTSKTGTIIYTVVNATDTIDDNSKNKFTFTVNLSVIDTVPPLMRFYHDKSTDGTSDDNLYTITTDSGGGILDDNDGCFRGEGNEVTITLAQSYVKNNPSANFLPKVEWYDQNNTTETTSDISIVKTLTQILDNPGALDASMIDLSYNAGEWRPGIYRLTYSCTDDNSINTTVDASFIIVDDIYPTLEISDVSDNSVIAYTDHVVIWDYLGHTITDGSSNDESGVGFYLVNNFISVKNDSANMNEKNLYIYYSDVSANTWTSPTITTQSDYDNITLDSSYTSIVNEESSVTLTTDDAGITEVKLVTAYGSNSENTSLIRTYSLEDFYDNSSEIKLNIYVYDDEPPIVSVKATPVLYKYYTTTTEGQVDANIIEIVTDNNIIGNPITINQYDEITFTFTTYKNCNCRIYNEITKTAIETSISTMAQTLTLTEKHTQTDGSYNLIFTIWDDNKNFYRFEQIINIEAIPIYTFRMHVDDIEGKQYLLLRFSGEGIVGIESQSLASLKVFVTLDASSCSAGGWWDDVTEQLWSFSADFIDDIMFNNKVFYTDNGSSSYNKGNSGYGGFLLAEVIGTLDTVSFDTTLFETGIFYEVYTLPLVDTSASSSGDCDKSILYIDYIDWLKISETGTKGSTAVSIGGYVDATNNVGLYRRDTTILLNAEGGDWAV